MELILLSLLVSALVFWATNLENQFILLAYFNHPQYSFRSVSIGYLASTGLILSGSYGASQVALAMSNTWIYFLGFMLILLRIWELLKLKYRAQVSQQKIVLRSDKILASRAMILVGAVTLASGEDSFVVFTSLFADTQYSADLVIFLTSLGMAVCWVALAQFLSGYEWISIKLQRFGSVLLPVLLILVGGFIVMDIPVDIV